MTKISSAKQMKMENAVYKNPSSSWMVNAVVSLPDNKYSLASTSRYIILTHLNHQELNGTVTSNAYAVS